MGMCLSWGVHDDGCVYHGECMTMGVCLSWGVHDDGYVFIMGSA